MDAFIGRYRVRLEKNGMLNLQHPTGLAFDVTPEEMLELLDFLLVYRQTLLSLTRQTDTELRSVVVEKDEKQDD